MRRQGSKVLVLDLDEMPREGTCSDFDERNAFSTRIEDLEDWLTICPFPADAETAHHRLAEDRGEVVFDRLTSAGDRHAAPKRCGTAGA